MRQARRVGGVGGAGLPGSREVPHGLSALAEDVQAVPRHPKVPSHRGSHVLDAGVVPRVADRMPCPAPAPPPHGVHVGRPGRKPEQPYLAAAAPREVPRRRRAVLRGPVDDDGDPAELAVRLPQVPDERAGVKPAVRAEELPAVVRERPERGEPAVAPRVRGADPLSHGRPVPCAPPGAVHEDRLVLHEQRVAPARQAPGLRDGAGLPPADVVRPCPVHVHEGGPLAREPERPQEPPDAGWAVPHAGLRLDRVAQQRGRHVRRVLPPHDRAGGKARRLRGAPRPG